MIKKVGLILWDVLVKAQRVVMIVTGIATILLVFVPIVLRQIGIPFTGYEEFLLPIEFWMYMMGSSHGSYERNQITADLLLRVLKGKPQLGLQALTSILTFLLGVVFTYWAWVLVQWSLSTGALSSLYKIPIVWGQSAIFVGLVISCLYNFVYMIKDCRNVFVPPCIAQTVEQGEV